MRAYLIHKWELIWHEHGHQLMNLVPKQVVYWCGIRLWSVATGPQFTTAVPVPPTQITMDEVLNRWTQLNPPSPRTRRLLGWRWRGLHQ